MHARPTQAGTQPTAAGTPGPPALTPSTQPHSPCLPHHSRAAETTQHSQQGGSWGPGTPPCPAHPPAQELGLAQGRAWQQGLACHMQGGDSWRSPAGISPLVWAGPENPGWGRDVCEPVCPPAGKGSLGPGSHWGPVAKTSHRAAATLQAAAPSARPGEGDGQCPTGERPPSPATTQETADPAVQAP